jgi:GWxTD domain-containing protein
MKFVTVVLLVIFLAVINARAQVEKPTEFASMAGKPKFFQDVLDFSPGKNNLTRLDVFIMVPYPSIQFIQSEKGYAGKYSVTISVFDKDKVKLVEEKTWNTKLEVNDFEHTTSKENNSVTMKSFSLPPGEYFIRSAVRDHESNNDYLLEKVYKVRDLSSDLAVSDVMLLAKKTEDKGVNKITPNITGDVTVQKDGLPFFYEIYTKNHCKLNTKYIILDAKKKKVFEDSMFKDVDSGRTQVFYTIKDSSINLGKYSLEVTLNNPENNLTVSTQRLFISRWTGVPALITDLDKAVDEMVYIASPHDIDTIEAARTKDEKLKRFLAYWKKLSPTPETDDNAVFNEYYQRVTYANEHFSKYFEGWNTDRGMVFILLGPPDNIQRHPFDLDSKPYEVWEYYNLNLSLVFVDRTGFGDYRLNTPLTGEAYKFRM